MTTLLKLAFRNVFRSKRRTLITFSSVSLGLALLVVIISLINGIDKQSMTNIINSQTSHITVFKKGYFDKRDELPMNITIMDPTAVKSLLKKIPGIKELESRITFGAGLIKGMDELPCKGVAVEPGKDPDLFNIKDSIVKGEWLKPDDAGMVVGEDFANAIDLKVGDIVTLRMVTSSQDEEFSWNAIDLEVKGIFDCGNPTVDAGTVFIPLKKAQESLALKHAVTEVAIRIQPDQADNLATVRNQVSKALNIASADYEVVSWKELAGTFLAISKSKTKSSTMIIMVILLIASMGIINTMFMAVMERTREIGMLAALGMKKSEIITLFLLEAGIIGFIGSIVGCIAGGLIGWYLEVEGWAIAAMGESFEKFTASSYPVKDVFYADVTLELLLVTMVFGTLVAVLAGVYPAKKAAGLDPVEALRHI